MGVINSKKKGKQMKEKTITITVNGDKTTLTLDEALTIRDTLICTAYEGLFDSCYVLQQHECEK